MSIVLLALAGCATGTRPASDDDPRSARDTLGWFADAELNQYRSAITALSHSELEVAQAELRRIAARRPALAGPWVNLALIDIRRNDFAGARQNLARALERNPRLPQAYNLRGYVELSEGNARKAADDYRTAIELRDDYAIAHYNYALVHDVYFQDLPTAIRHYRRYLELTNAQDTRTAEWVAELERQLPGAPQ